MLGIGIVRRCHLDNICCNKVDALEATNDSAQLTSRPATSLRCASGRCKSRVEGVDVERQVDGLGGANAGLDLVDDALDANLLVVDLAGLDDLEAAVAIILIVAGSGEGGADAGMDVGVVG